MKRELFNIVGILCASSALATSTKTFSATDEASIFTTGPGAASSLTFAGNKTGTSLESFGVIDVNTTAFSNRTIGDIELNLTQTYSSTNSNAAFKVYLVPATSTSISASNTSLTFNPSTIGGYTSQLGTGVLVGGGLFKNPTINTTSTNSVSLYENNATLVSDIASGSPIRLVIVSTSSTGAGTFATGSTAGPSLSFKETPTPEPATIIALGAGLVGLMRRRKTA